MTVSTGLYIAGGVVVLVGAILKKGWLVATGIGCAALGFVLENPQ